MWMRKLHSSLSHLLDLMDLVAGRDQKVGIQTGDSRQTGKKSGLSSWPGSNISYYIFRVFLLHLANFKQLIFFIIS